MRVDHAQEAKLRDEYPKLIEAAKLGGEATSREAPLRLYGGEPENPQGEWLP